jgi:hypothetical protein
MTSIAKGSGAFTLIVVITFMSLLGCNQAASRRHSVEGKWESADGSEQHELLSDGTDIVTSRRPLAGTWSLIDDGRLIIKLSSLGITLPYVGVLESGNLRLTGGSPPTATYLFRPGGPKELPASLKDTPISAPGFWEVRSAGDLGQGSSKTCLGRTQLIRAAIIGASRCQPQLTHEGGSVWRIQQNCNNNQIEAVVTGDLSRLYQSVITMKMASSNVVKETTTSTRIGDCPSDFKPGDTEVNGQRTKAWVGVGKLDLE